MKVYLNGKFVEKEDARISLFEPGFLCGQGLFETMRAYNRKIFRLDSHIQRLVNAARLINLKLDIPSESLADILISCLKENNLKDAYVRLTVWQGQDTPGVAAFAKEYNFFKKENYGIGLKAVISSFRQNEHSVLSAVKSSNYLNLLLAYQEAIARGKDEAILLNSRGFVAEASRANIFLVKDNCLITPSLSCGCLPGITRDTVLGIAAREKIPTIEADITPGELKNADEAFLTNSLIEVMPLVVVDEALIKKGVPGKITEAILKIYRGLTAKS